MNQAGLDTNSDNVSKTIKQYLEYKILFRWIKKLFFHWCYGKCELERICSGGSMTVHDLLCFRSSILLSTKFPPNVRDFLINPEKDKLADNLYAILHIKKIHESQKRTIFNIRGSLERYIMVSKNYEHLHQRKKIGFDWEIKEHENLLNDLWDGLMPDIRRDHPRLTKQWGEIGFQGENPQTDFRSTGILSLENLVYFCQNYPTESREVLFTSNHPDAWFPFACVGISITNFVLDLASERLLDYVLLDESVTDTKSGLLQINEYYCSIFNRFHIKWIKAKPKDLMAFPEIFSTVKLEVRQEAMKNSMLTLY